MNLKETARRGLQEKKKELNLENFGEIMDEFIQKSSCGLAVYKEEGEEDFRVEGAGCGAVIDFYIFLCALPDIYRRMLEEMGGREAVDAERLAEALADMLEKGMLEAVAQDE